MKRIKEYFNKHHKLKKIASILGIAVIVLSFTFNAVILATAIYQNVQERNNNQTLVYGDYNPKLAGTTTDNNNQHQWLYFSLSDFANQYYIDPILEAIADQNGRSSSYPRFDDLSSSANGPINVTYSNLTNVRIRVSGIDEVPITWISFKINNSTYGTYRSLRIDMGNNTTYTQGYVGMLIYFQPYDETFGVWLEDGTTREYITCPNYTIVNFDSYITYGNTLYIPASVLFYSPTLTNNSSLSAILSSYNNKIDNMLSNAEDIGYQDGYSTGHDAGYLEGREDGYEFGYSEGYDAGYDSGLNENEAFSLGYHDGYNDGETAGYNTGYAEGKTGISNNPFKLIANSFDAVASILNIQVLPNLSLGVLIFTPLIVMIIIVVVKFMRG